MELKLRKWFLWLGVVVLAIVSVVVIEKLWHFDKSDWAAWAQAIGSVAAIGSAIWLAGQEDRRRNKQALVSARLVAAGITIKISTGLTTVQSAHKWFDQTRQFDGDPMRFDWWVQKLSALEFGTREEQLALVPLPNGCAFKLAAANDRLHTTVRMLASFADSPGLQESERRRETASGAAFLFQEVVALLSSAVEECKASTTALTHLRP